MKLTAITYPDTTPDGQNPGFSSHCPELDVASQGDTEEEARDNLREALELFLEDVDPDELARRLAAGARVSQLELAA
jgi:predicted RNase H-like HicB family nuclease